MKRRTEVAVVVEAQRPPATERRPLYLPAAGTGTLAYLVSDAQGPIAYCEDPDEAQAIAQALDARSPDEILAEAADVETTTTKDFEFNTDGDPVPAAEEAKEGES